MWWALLVQVNYRERKEFGTRRGGTPCVEMYGPGLDAPELS